MRRWLVLGGMIGLLALALPLVAAGARSQSSADPVLVGAGDIADCKNAGAAATARLVEQIPGTVFTLGDNAYPAGSVKQFAECYDTTWGSFKERTRPAAGNHDYTQRDAAAYYAYFGAAAGQAGKGFYSYDLGTWHIIVLNSDCAQVAGGCGPGSPQEQWLAADLAAHPALCTLAYWHHPLFGSSASHTNNTDMQPMWWDLYRAGADVVLNGHAHNYERLAPVDPKGVPDPEDGIREFIVGTGGRDHRQFSKVQPYSEVRNRDTFGVLKLTLHAGNYDWQFIPETSKSFTDTGNGTCH